MLEPAQRVAQLVHARDADVEVEFLDTLRHVAHGAVGEAAQVERIAGICRAIVSGGGGFDQAPEFLDRAPCAAHAGLGPFEVAFGRRVGQREPARAIGAVVSDDLQRVDDVLLRLRHFLDGADGDRPLRSDLEYSVVAFLDLLGQQPAA